MSWEPRHEKLYKDGVLIHHRVQRTPDGPWEDYVPEEPLPPKENHMKAFPNMTNEKGMDLRDYFAAKAMPLAMEWFKHNYCKELGDRWSWSAEDAEEIAATAYLMADEMIKAREAE